MAKHIGITIIITSLIIVAWWGNAILWQKPPLPTPSPLSATDHKLTPNKTEADTDAQPISSEQAPQQNVLTLLKQGHYVTAIEQFNDAYGQLSTAQIEDLERAVFETALQALHQQKTSQAIRLLTLYTASYQHPQAWYLLGIAYSDTDQLDLAVAAFLESSLIEYQPERLAQVESALQRSAHQRQQQLAKQQDWVAINDLYLQLYHQFPNTALFQLELAKSYLNLEQTQQATPLLKQLQYDPQLSHLANKLLNQIEPKDTQQSTADNPQPKPTSLTIPLTRAGNSFLVTVTINRKPLTLLLDTGASITSLSTNAIKTLRLSPNGRRIRLNTANGTRQSQLYNTSQIQLGNATLKGLPIAEVDLGNNTRIQGLLGTDFLNHFNYVIDNQKNALILNRPTKQSR